MKIAFTTLASLFLCISIIGILHYACKHEIVLFSNKSHQVDPQDKDVVTKSFNKDQKACTDFYNRTEGQLSLHTLPEFIKNNKAVVDVLESNCLQVYQTIYTDITGDGEKDIILNTEDINCVACRNTRLLVFSKNKLISDTYISDSIIRPIEGRDNAFEVKEPVRGIALEGACCPSTGLVKVYEYFGDSYSGSHVPGFAFKDIYTEKYSNEQYGPEKERINYN